MEPNKTNLSKWVDALRSDEYPQGRRALVSRDFENKMLFCCLGVACEVAIKDGLELVVYTVPEGEGGDGEARSYDGQYSTLPIRVQAWLGVYEADPVLPFEVVKGQVENDMASSLNDDAQLTFAQIADCIERRFGLGREASADA